jgi:hypothetical protein
MCRQWQSRIALAIVAAVAICSTCFDAVAQDGPAPSERPLTPINVALFHPIALFPDADQRRVGFELSLTYGVAAGITGVGIAGAVLVSHAAVQGVQIAPVTVAERELDGVQLGVVNVAQRIQGVQLGLVNVAQRTSGLQLGLVNVGEVDGYQLGLLNLPPSLQVSALLWASGLPFLASVGARFSTRRGRLYTLIGLGYGQDASHRFFAPSYGLGLRFIPARWLLDVDVLYQPEFASSDRARHVLQLRGCAGFRVIEPLALFVGAGPALEFSRSEDPQLAARAFGGAEWLF